MRRRRVWGGGIGEWGKSKKKREGKEVWVVRERREGGQEAKRALRVLGALPAFAMLRGAVPEIKKKKKRFLLLRYLNEKGKWGEFLDAILEEKNEIICGRKEKKKGPLTLLVRGHYIRKEKKKRGPATG